MLVSRWSIHAISLHITVGFGDAVSKGLPQWSFLSIQSWAIEDNFVKITCNLGFDQSNSVDLPQAFLLYYLLATHVVFISPWYHYWSIMSCNSPYHQETFQVIYSLTSPHPKHTTPFDSSLKKYEATYIIKHIFHTTLSFCVKMSMWWREKERLIISATWLLRYHVLLQMCCHKNSLSIHKAK